LVFRKAVFTKHLPLRGRGDAARRRSLRTYRAGLSPARSLRNQLRIGRLEAIDGTAVIDIKLVLAGLEDFYSNLRGLGHDRARKMKRSHPGRHCRPLPSCS